MDVQAIVLRLILVGPLPVKCPSGSQAEAVSPFAGLPVVLTVSLSCAREPPSFEGLPSPFFGIAATELVGSAFSLSHFPVAIYSM